LIHSAIPTQWWLVTDRQS